jgi:hypothetical protein
MLCPSLPVASRNVTETLDADFVYGLPEILGRSLYAYLHPPSGVDEVGSHGSLSLLSEMKVMV